MTHYSDNSGSVRVDFHNAESGKWKYTEAVDMSDHWDDVDIHEALRLSIEKHTGGKRLNLDNYIAVCAEPYHRNAYPIMLTPGRASYEPYPKYERIFAPTRYSTDGIAEGMSL